MNIYLEPQPDSLLVHPAQPWTSVKLDYLTRYLAMFTTSMREKPWRALNYIDLFAGPGKCQEGNDKVLLGSPLLALTAPKPFDHYFFIDLKPDNIQALQHRCQSSPYADRVQYFTEDCNVAVHQIAEEICLLDKLYLKGQWSCLNLAFIDPYGFKVQWETVKILAQLRTDLIIHYSQMGIQRNLSKEVDSPTETAIDRFFGTSAWREVYRKERKSRVYGELISFYKQNLCALGYTEVKSEDELLRVPLMRNTKDATLYGLIFASKNPLGEKFWRQVTNRDVHGQLRFL